MSVRAKAGLVGDLLIEQNGAGNELADLTDQVIVRILRLAVDIFVFT